MTNSIKLTDEEINNILHCLAFRASHPDDEDVDFMIIWDNIWTQMSKKGKADVFKS